MALGTEIIILVIFLVLSGFFSGAEVALVSLSRAKVRQMVEEKIRGATYIKRLKDDPQRMLSTILIGNNIVNVGASALATVVTLRLFDSYAVSIATGIMTLLILVFGGITPKTIAATHNVAASKIVAPIIWYLSIILSPILIVLDGFLKRFLRLLGVKTQEAAISEEEIKSMISAAKDEGSIKEMENKCSHNIFESMISM